jgi:predicted HAD superfamily Cof-like phosphohydrolase
MDSGGKIQYRKEKVMRTNFEMVEEFMESFGQEVKTKSEFPDNETITLRYELIDEELKELREAIGNADMVEVADALTDLLYVVYGAGHAFGINLDKCFEEVHSSNMSKLGADGKPIYREDGKVLKGENFFQPNLSKVLGL